MKLKSTQVTAMTALMALLLFAGPPLAAHEDDPGSVRDRDPSPYRATASRAAPGTPKIDGTLDEPVWALAEPFGDFIQRDPDEGESATERTEVRVLYDDGAVYIAIRAFDSDPSKIVGRLTRRDQWSSSDWLTVSIDSYFDRRTAFEFRVNPAGVERDTYRFDDTRADDSWNAVWDVSTSVDEQGWIAEFRIPFSQLRFSEAAEQTWGFNVTRFVQRKNETSHWKPIPKEGSGWVSEYGDLVGIQGITPPRRLELLPYVVAQEALTPEEPGNPFETGSDLKGTTGLDLKYGVTNNFTLDLTLNPDFGQVEADPSVVNLSVFETFFEEKRPFFLEGANIFGFGLRQSGHGAEQLFYSRRIGRRPQGDADSRGGYVDMPVNTSIVAATKFSGKSANGWSIGVLDALTAEEQAHVIDLEGNEFKDVVEPLTNFGVFRAQRDFRDGQSAVGLMFTTVNRRLTESLDFLRESAYSGGIDGRHRFWGQNWELTGKLMGSHIRGSEEAIESVQTSSARFYQRPDADHLDLDPTRTSLTGQAGAFGFSKIGGGHWRGSLATEWRSPGFEVNDLGFQRRADAIQSSFWIAYREFQPGKIFRRWNLNYNAWNHYTFGRERTATGTNVNGSFSLLNYWGGFAGINREFEALNIRVLRGGPAMTGPGAWNGWMGFYSDDRKALSMDAGTWFWNDDERSSAGGFWGGVSFRPSDNVRLRLSPNYDWTHDDWQFVTTETVSGTDQYVLGVLDQKTISLTTRLDWTFTPNLSLQLYAQPFVSAGDYTVFRGVADPRAPSYDDRFDEYGPDRLSFTPSDDPDDAGTYSVDANADGNSDFEFSDPNFNFKQLRSTIVLRWEYLQGSTVFFVWNGSKTRFDPTGRFSPGRDFGDLLSADSDNVFLVKVNYYLNP